VVQSSRRGASTGRPAFVREDCPPKPGRRRAPFTSYDHQGVAQPGRAPRLERGGRRFESCRPDQSRPRSSSGPEQRPPMPQVARSSRAVDSTRLRGASRVLRRARSSHHGELAERQGIAVLTRRDRKVAQVRSLHSPPLFAASPRKPSAEARRAKADQTESRYRGHSINGRSSGFHPEGAGSNPAARSTPPSSNGRTSRLEREDRGSNP
jgi:hypothetical protein